MTHASIVEEVYASLQNTTQEKHLENIQSDGYTDMQKLENIECTNVITSTVCIQS